MGTRCVVTFDDGEEKFSVYKHSDGYPDGDSGILRDIQRAMNFSWDLPRFQAGEFAASFIAITKLAPGAVSITQSAEHHGDLRYSYHVTCKGSFLHVAVFNRKPFSDEISPHGTHTFSRVGR